MVEQVEQKVDLEFLGWLHKWTSELPTARIDRPANTLIVVVDMVNGFCKTGNLASERVGNLIEPVVNLLRDANESGVKRFLIAEDTHRQNDPEFSAFPPHCIAGSGEERTVEEITSLPFARRFEIFPKPTLNISIGTDMDDRLGQLLDQGTDTFIVAGDCTDLCVYHAASFLRLVANARDRAARVIVPAGAVNTYDLDVESATGLGALPHPGELLHQIFLYHLALIGCEVVADIGWSATA